MTTTPPYYVKKMFKKKVPVFLGLFVIFLLLRHVNTTNIFGTNPILDAAFKSASLKKLDHCFCELTGPVDVCCCDVETVDSLNNVQIYPIISNLVQQNYFRYFKINFKRSCPFWSDDGRCVLKNCHVEQCTEDEVPTFLKGEKGQPIGGSGQIDCDPVSEEERRLSSLVDVISPNQVKEFAQWALHDDDFCHLEDDLSVDATYVDLVVNPERYTGYSGHSPHRIWSAIYNENCFKIGNVFNLQDACLEKRAFFRLISGIHSSINIHLSANYILSGGNTDNPKFGPNLNEFVKRFDTSATNSQGPSWLKNLYFAYLVVLRAIIKAEMLWTNYTFYTGNTDNDQLIKQEVLQLITAAKGCGQNLFDESQMFTGNAASQLKEEFRAHFLNISRIMDCVGCDKCRLWGTLQIQGVGTALKILFNNKNISQLQLTRQEIVALFNVLGKLSDSIKFLEEFKNMQVAQSHSQTTTHKVAQSHSQTTTHKVVQPHSQTNTNKIVQSHSQTTTHELKAAQSHSQTASHKHQSDL